MKCSVLLATTVTKKKKKMLGETSLKFSAFLAKTGLSFKENFLTSEGNCSVARVVAMCPRDDWLAMNNKTKNLQLP